MTCCNIITPPTFTIIDNQSTHQQRVMVDTSNGQVELIMNFNEYGLFYLTIHIQSNFLYYDPYRFVIFNATEQRFEEPQGVGFLLFKNIQYEIYDRDEMILSLNPSMVIF